MDLTFCGEGSSQQESENRGTATGLHRSISQKAVSQCQMQQEATLSRARLKTPPAAAISGILFSVLLITGPLLLRLSVRADPLETGAWLKTSSNKVGLALNLVPFAGIAFHRRTARPPGRARRSLLCHGLSRQRAFVPRHAVRVGRRGGRNHHGLHRQARRVARLGDVPSPAP
jgi:hypothetical protein